MREEYFEVCVKCGEEEPLDEFDLCVECNPVRAIEYIACGICGDKIRVETRNGITRRKYCDAKCRKIADKRSIERRKKSPNEYRRFRILNRDEFTCIYCGESSIEDGSKLHVDHIYPKSKGGTDTAGNLVTSCILCNLSKQDLVLIPAVMKRLRDRIAERNQQHGMSDDTVIKLNDYEM